LLRRLIKKTATASEYVLTFSGNVASCWLAALSKSSSAVLIVSLINYTQSVEVSAAVSGSLECKDQIVRAWENVELERRERGPSSSWFQTQIRVRREVYQTGESRASFVLFCQGSAVDEVSWDRFDPPAIIIESKTPNLFHGSLLFYDPSWRFNEQLGTFLPSVGNFHPFAWLDTGDVVQHSLMATTNYIIRNVSATNCDCCECPMREGMNINP